MSADSGSLQNEVKVGMILLRFFRDGSEVLSRNGVAEIEATHDALQERE
jgi:hypothetical protein